MTSSRRLVWTAPCKATGFDLSQLTLHVMIDAARNLDPLSLDRCSFHNRKYHIVAREMNDY